jgi:hypothetical protein
VKVGVGVGDGRMTVGVGVCVAVAVGVFVWFAVGVAVGDAVGVVDGADVRAAVGEVCVPVLVGFWVGDLVGGKVAVGGMVTVGGVTMGVGGGVSVGGGSNVIVGRGVLVLVRVRVTVGVSVWVGDCVKVRVGDVGVGVQGTAAAFPCPLMGGATQGAAGKALPWATHIRMSADPQLKARFATRMSIPLANLPEEGRLSSYRAFQRKKGNAIRAGAA